MFAENLTRSDVIEDMYEEFIEELFGERPFLSMAEFNQAIIGLHGWIFDTDACRKRAV